LIQACFLEAGLNRGDLTKAEWRVLKGLLKSKPKTVVEADGLSKTVRSSTASSGGFVAALHGVIRRGVPTPIGTSSN
jgi:hypothetical protein